MGGRRSAIPDPGRLGLDAAVLAGQPDRAVLASSLVPPGTTVALGPGAPPGIEGALAMRGCDVADGPVPDIAVVGPDDPTPDVGRALLVCAELAAHANTVDGGSTVDRLVAAGQGDGRHLLAVQRQYEAPPPGSDGGTLDDWTRWAAVLVGGTQAAPPTRLPHDRPAAVGALFLADDPFWRWPPARRRRVLEVGGELAQDGLATVISWTPGRLTGSLGAHLDLRRLGYVLHGGDGVTDLEHGAAETVAPTVQAMLCTYEPLVCVLLDIERGGDDLKAGAHRSLGTRYVGLGMKGGVLEHSTTDETLAEDVVGLARTPYPTVTARTPVIARRPRQPGVTSIVIPVHGRWDLTAACLRSIRQTTEPDEVEVLVVDNACPDRTAERLAGDPSVQVLENDRNLGFAAGTNRGLVAATGEHVCLLNNDTEVAPGWLAELRAALDVPGTGIAGPRSNSVSGFQVIPGAPTMANPDVHRWAQDQARARRGGTWMAGRLVGFCMLLRGDLLEELGGLDESVGLGNFEDDDLCIRVQQRGLTLRVADGAVVLHHGSATFSAAGISVLGTMRGAARRNGPLTHPRSQLVSARVVPGDDPGRLRDCLQRLCCIADEVVIPTDDHDLEVALHTVDIAPGAIHVIRTRDTPETLARWSLHLDDPVAVDPRDWGATRAALEALDTDRDWTFEALPGVRLEAVRHGRVEPPRNGRADSSTVLRPSPAGLGISLL